MAWPLIRIDLDEKSHDFQRIALQPGFPILDRFGANAISMRKWLGRFAAEAQWDQQTVRFLYRDDQHDFCPKSVAAASLADLRGLLKSEVFELQDLLKRAAPKSTHESILLTILKQRMERALTGGGKELGTFYKVRIHNQWKLVWCWGYERRNANRASLSICSQQSCRLAFCDNFQTRYQCPRCQTKMKTRRVAATSMIVGILVLLLGGFGYFAWDRAGKPGFVKPSVSIQGVVVDAVNGQPISHASVQLATNARQMLHSNELGEFEFSFESGREERLEISAPGYLSSIWEPTGKGVPSDRMQIALRGASEVTGLVIERGTDRPIPFPKIRSLGTDYQVTGDDVGLFFLPGIPSGNTEFEISAEGYRVARVTQELKPDRSSDLLFDLTGASTADGTVIDALNNRPIGAATIKVNDLPGETVCDENGKFRWEELPGTTCHFEVSAPGYFSREFERPLAPSGETKLKFLLRPELTALTGLVVDSTGVGISAAIVRVVEADAVATTSSNGRFRLNGLRKGKQQLEVTSEGYPSLTLDVDVPVLSEGGMHIVLKGSAKLAGRIVDATRKNPLLGVEVRLDRGKGRVTTNSEGTFEFHELPLQPSSLEVRGAGYKTARSEIDLRADETIVNFELQRSTVIRGTVISTFDQLPIEGARVAIEQVQPQFTDAEGNFRFEEIAGGVVRLSVSCAGFQSIEEVVNTRDEVDTRLDLRLVGANRLVGKIVAAESNCPIPQAEIKIKETSCKFVTDENGEFAKGQFPARKLRLHVTANGYLPLEVDANLRDHSADSLLIRLSSQRVVNGIVVDARSDKPITGASVTCAENAKTTMSDKDGRFQFEIPQANSYEFSIAAAGYPPQSFVEWLKSGKLPLEKPTNDVSHSGHRDLTIKFALKRDSDDVTMTSNSSSLPSMSSRDTDVFSADEVFGRPPQRNRDQLDVEFSGIRAKGAMIGFVVDRSGSMSGKEMTEAELESLNVKGTFEGTRLERAELELIKSVIDLHPQQRYFVTFFDERPHPMFIAPDSKYGSFPSTFKEHQTPIAASPINKARTYKWIKSIHLGAGTNPEPALLKVAELNPEVIFLLSDGEFSPLSESLYDHFKQKEIQVNTIAFEDESGSRHLDLIAKRTQGGFRFVPQAAVPELCELSLVTQLYDELLEQLLDPNTSPTVAADAHEGLIEFCNDQDFGPRHENVTDRERQMVRHEWRRWWVENKLTPQLRHYGESRLKKNLENSDFWWRWASLQALANRGFEDASVFVQGVRDKESCIQQAVRRILVRLAIDEDYGPVDEADAPAISEAFKNWTEWWSREKYIKALPKKNEASLVKDFESPDLKTRRAAVQLAAEKKQFNQLPPLIERLNDHDSRVRQSAHSALCKATNQNFGPADISDLSQCASAARDWSKWTIGQTENRAENFLRAANALSKKNRTQGAQNLYQLVIEKFPNTDAAKKASEILQAMH